MKKKLYINTIISILSQLVTIIIGLILPRLMLITYGSDVNGLVSSITQMLGFITLLDLGIGAVVQASLYKPLSQKNNKQISLIFSSAQKYFQIIAKILLVYILGLCLYYVIFKSNNFSWIYTVTLIISISISSFAQYYFGICNTLLLNADQKIYVSMVINIVTLILSAIISIILMDSGASIQIVKLISSIIFIIRPLFLKCYVQKNYKIEHIKNPPKNILKNKWSGLAQHISTVLTGSLDYVVLTIFSSFSSFSIYNIYVLPLNSIRGLMESLSGGYKSFLGKLIAETETIKLQYEFDRYETFIHFSIVVIFSCISVVLVPFVLVYTSGVDDVNYQNFLFSYLITLAYAIYAMRIPYTTIIFSAGHFRETQIHCIIEVVLNLIISIGLVFYFDLIGVAIGTCISVGYRLLSSVVYLQNNILNRKIFVFIKHLIIDIICIILILLLIQPINFGSVSLISWIIYASKVFFICLLISFIIHVFFYPNIFKIKFLHKKGGKSK